MNDPLVDFVCVRDTHQFQPSAPVISVQSGALMLCPRGESLGHVWRAAATGPLTDDRSIIRDTAARGRLARLSIRTDT